MSIRVLILILLFCVTVPAAAKPIADSPTVDDMLTCVKDADCSLREGSCGYTPMNVYFDNAPLLEMATRLECDRPPTYVNPRCEAGRCTADIVVTEHLDKYVTDMTYCEKDADCALRESTCANAPMNIHFDNRPLIAARPYSSCPANIAYANPRCEENKCVGDLKTLEPISADPAE